MITNILNIIDVNPIKYYRTQDCHNSITTISRCH